MTQTVYVSNLTVDNGAGTVGTELNLATLITDKTDSTGTPTAQAISYALVNADQTLTGLSEKWTPTQSGTYRIQYSYIDANSGLQVTAIVTIIVKNGTLVAPKDVTQTATSFVPPLTLTNQSGNAVTVTAKVSGNADLSALTPGTYTITYTASGYDTVTQKLIITAPATPATTTVDHTANNGDGLTPSRTISLAGNVGDSVTIPTAAQVAGNNKTGYTLTKITFNGAVVQAGDTVTLAEKNALVYHYTKNPVNTDISVTKNVDEKGNVLSDTTGYELVSSTVNPPVVVVINPDGDTETTITTVKVWKRKVNPIVPDKTTPPKRPALHFGGIPGVKSLPDSDNQQPKPVSKEEQALPNTGENSDNQQSKPATKTQKTLPNTGETSDSKLLSSGVSLMTLLIATLGIEILKKRKKEL